MHQVIQKIFRKVAFVIRHISGAILFSVFLIPANNVFAEDLNYSVSVEPALNITTSSDKVSLNLNPLTHDFDSQNLNVSVSTNNITGYKLYVNTSTTDLVEKNDSNLTIKTLDKEASGEDDFALNSWGYRLNSGNYLPFQPGALVSSSKVAIEDNLSTLTFAAKVGYETKAGTYNLALNFQATANPLIHEMQDLDSSLCTETPMTVVDNRDEQEYVIQRLKDGKCWMMTNLNLGTIDSDVTLDNTNTNINDGSTILASDWNSYKKDSAVGSYVAAEYVQVPGTESSNGLPFGTLYNYCAASANTICVSANSPNATSDICPAGWRLPVGGSSSDFSTLYSNPAYNSETNMRKSYTSGGAAFVLAGGFSGGGPPTSQNRAGNYWTSTWWGGGAMYNMYLVYGSVLPNYSNYRSYGFSIRCVLK